MKVNGKCFLLVGLFLLLTLFSMGYGTFYFSPYETLHYLYLSFAMPEGSGDIGQEVIQFIRLPHLVLSFCIGAGLAVCGTVMQAVMKNPLADPYLLGISSGASLGAVLAIWAGVGTFCGLDGVGAFSFLGAGLVSMLILFLSAVTGRGGSLTLLLSGFALNAACSAMVSFIITAMADTSKTRSVQFWMMGNLRIDTWTPIFVILAIVFAGILYFFSRRRVLDLMLMGDDISLTLGQKLSFYRKICIAVTALMVGAMVYISGMIGFVGLLVPHGVRFLVGSSHEKVLPLSALAGGTFLCWADIIGRNLMAGVELPIGVTAALVGSPFFVWMLLSGKYVNR